MNLWQIRLSALPITLIALQISLIALPTLLIDQPVLPITQQIGPRLSNDGGIVNQGSMSARQVVKKAVNDQGALKQDR